MRGVNKMLLGALTGTGLRAAIQSDVTPGVVPLAPGPGDVFKQGGTCTFSYTPDPSGLWKQTDVELMTGDNFHMIYLDTIASFDGTDASKTSGSFPCPAVTPNSAIYFLQFSTPAAPTNLTWTTRWTIAGADGSSTAPEFTNTPTTTDGVKWGVGALADPSAAKAPPSYLQNVIVSNATSSTSGSTSGLTTSSGSVSSSASTTSSKSSASVAQSAGTTNSGPGSTTTRSSSASTPTGNSTGNGSSAAVGLEAPRVALAVGALTAVAAALLVC